MKDTIRDAPIGQIIRWITKNKYLKYPEEEPDFQCPSSYSDPSYDNYEKPPIGDETPNSDNLSTPKPAHTSDPIRGSIHELISDDPEKAERDGSFDHRDSPRLPPSVENDDAVHRLNLERTKSKPIIPQRTRDGVILVDWYTEDDPANPHNWSNSKRIFVSFIICAYTFVVYSASAIYTSSELGLENAFHVNATDASLPLSLYVLAYGIGPLVFSPLSEIPIIGRNPIYATTFVLFVILSVPTALVGNFAGFLVLRFLQGFFGSPCLATGAATFQDMYSMLNLPYALIAWVSAAYCGPALGPLISGFAVTAEGWRWSMWEILWAAGPVMVVMLLFLPETYAPNLLLRRAQRLRKLTGNTKLQSQSEIDQRHMKPSTVAWDAIIKPMEITFKDPAIAFVNLYTALIYGIYYSFFEVFPLVYVPFYGFSIGMIGVVFLCVLVACLIGVAIYVAYLRFYLIPDIMAHGMRAQEHRLVPAIIGSFGPVIGLFLFAWTANPSIHWIACTIGIVIYGCSVFIVMQCIFVYVPMSYPQYAASLFAANDFLRSAMACGSILFARPLFINLGVGKGVSLLGGLSVLGVIGMFVLYFFGAKLRARSKFAMA